MNYKKNDWNQISYQLIKAKNEIEIQKLINITKPYLLYYFKGSEDDYQDWLLRILKYIDTYNPEKGLFSTWLYTLAVSVHKTAYEKRQRQIKTCGFDYSELSEKNQLYIIDNPEYLEKYTIEEKQELENRLNKLDELDRQFINEYWNNEIDKGVKQRMKYSRLIKKLSK